MQRDSSIPRESLNKLLENPRVWRGQNQSHTEAGLSTGYKKLDQHLPGGGWPQQSLTEILVGQYGIGELQLLMPALASLSVDDPLARTVCRAGLDCLGGATVSAIPSCLTAKGYQSVAAPDRAAEK